MAKRKPIKKQNKIKMPKSMNNTMMKDRKTMEEMHITMHK